MDLHDHTHGLSADLEQLIRQAATRRRALRWLVAGGASLGIAGCGGSADDASSTSTSSSSSGTSSSSGSATCSVIPSETNGPYPGDGSNTLNGTIVNALALSGIVRSDITSSFGGASGSASGVPLTVNIQLVNTHSSCATLEGYAVYIWHCSAAGLYSMYSSGVTGQNWLRGVQATDSSGVATFSTIFPGCYLGRMPHIHFEIYPSLSTATSNANQVKTSQMAFPSAICDSVYALSSYGTSESNFAQISFATDNVFSDGYSTQLATISGDVASGYVATLEVGIAV